VALALDTPRLVLRRWQPEDGAVLAAINSDPEVSRYLVGGTPVSAERSAEQSAWMVRHWSERGFGLWAAVLRETDETIGFVGLAVPAFLPAVLPAVEVGWRLGRAWWGRGLATEGARASLAHGFAELGLARIIALIDPRNTASVRVAEKVGMAPGGAVLHPRTRVRLTVYETGPAPHEATIDLQRTHGDDRLRRGRLV